VILKEDACKGVDQASEALWHARVGHLNRGDLRVVSDTAYPTCTPGTAALPAAASTSAVGTECRSAGGRPRLHSTRRFEMIHSDIMEMPIAKDGSRYVIPFTDDYSRGLWAYAMRWKHEALQKYSTPWISRCVPIGRYSLPLSVRNLLIWAPNCRCTQTSKCRNFWSASCFHLMAYAHKPCKTATSAFDEKVRNDPFGHYGDADCQRWLQVRDPPYPTCTPGTAALPAAASTSAVGTECRSAGGPPSSLPGSDVPPERASQVA
jgi:hypothetical protein